MARDRLAALRAQQASGGSGFTGVRSDQHNAPTQQGQYEMTNINDGNTNGGGADMAFYDEVSNILTSIKEFNGNVARISDLQARALNNLDDQAEKQTQRQLETQVDETRTLSNQLKKRIETLHNQIGTGDGSASRKEQVGLVQSKFVEAIQNYQEVEKQNRAKYRQRMERQFKIVKPDATPEEVRAVVEDDQGGQIFTQALLNSNRYGESRAAYREVQERHEDIKRIEKTLTELAQLFGDMSVLVAQSDDVLDEVQGEAQKAERDLEAGHGQTVKAVDHARAARRKRWICFWLTIVIILVLALALGIPIGCHFAHC